MVHIKDSLLLIGKSSLCSAGSGFPLSLRGRGLSPYVRRQITVTSVLSLSLNKTTTTTTTTTTTNNNNNNNNTSSSSSSSTKSII